MFFREATATPHHQGTGENSGADVEVGGQICYQGEFSIYARGPFSGTFDSEWARRFIVPDSNICYLNEKINPLRPVHKRLAKVAIYEAELVRCHPRHWYKLKRALGRHR